MNFQPVLFCIAALAMALLPATAAHGAAVNAAAALPGDSVYHLKATLTDQNGKSRDFAAGAGQPVIAAMFYSSCKFICPLIIDGARKTERALAADERERLGVLLVSLDPERDTPAVLTELARTRHIDSPRWHLTRASEKDVRRIAAVLGVQYKQQEDGEFSHSSALILLDAQGRVVARSEKLGEADPEFLAAIRRTLATP